MNIRSIFNASWDMLTRDRGWFKPVLLLCIATFIPIVGPLFTLGYCLEWARLTAWGIDAAPKQSGIAYGECVKSGFRGFVVIFVYGLVAAFATGIVSFFFGWIPLIEMPLRWLSSLVSIAVTIVGYVAAIRATIYQRVGAGFQMDRVWDMVSEDYRGLASILIIQVLWMIVTTVIATIAVMLMMGPAYPAIVDAAEAIREAVVNGVAPSREAVVTMTYEIVGTSIPAVTGIGIFSLISTTMLRMIVMNAVGVWMRRFDVPRWSTSEAPLPQRTFADGAPTSY